MLPGLLALAIGIILLCWLAFHVAQTTLVILITIAGLLFMAWLVSMTPWWQRRP